MLKKLTVLLLAIILAEFNVIAQNPTRWRGPNSNGIYEETGLMKKWPSSGPEILWSFAELGEGHSSPAIANETIYLSGMLDGDGYIFALTLDGELKWKKFYGKEFTESYPGARSTPVIAGDLLYIYSGLGLLTCMNSIDGKIVWQKDAFKDFDGKNIRWGVTETVVVDDDVVYLTPGGKKNNVVALNRFNGELIWTSEGMKEVSGYCTPLLVELQRRKLLITLTADHIIGLDASTGKLLWSHPHTNRYQVHANTPIYYDGGLFCFSGYGQGGVKLDLIVEGSSVKKAWFNEKLDSRMGGMVLVDGYLYGSGDVGREWRCVDWKTGEEKYASSELGKGAVIYADGMLYCYSERGELALVKASPNAFEIVSKTKVELGTAQHWSHPVINAGRLYVRHGNTLIAYKIK